MVMVCEPNKSLLKMVRVADLGPGLLGLKRMTKSMDAPGLTASGYEATAGTVKSDEGMMLMFDINNSLKPELLMVRISSRGQPAHALVKSPPLAIAVTMIGAGASAASSRPPLILPQPVQGSQP